MSIEDIRTVDREFSRLMRLAQRARSRGKAHGGIDPVLAAKLAAMVANSHADAPRRGVGADPQIAQRPDQPSFQRGDKAPHIAYRDVKITKSQPGTRAYGALGEKAEAERKAAQAKGAANG